MYVWLVPGLFRGNPARSYVDFQIPRIHTVKKHSHQHKASDNKIIRLKFCWLPFLRLARRSYFIKCKNHALVQVSATQFCHQDGGCEHHTIFLERLSRPDRTKQEIAFPLMTEIPCLTPACIGYPGYRRKRKQIQSNPSWTLMENWAQLYLRSLVASRI